MLDPFQKLVSQGVTPEFSTQDQVAQLYIEYSATPNPEMMEYFYECFKTYWQCACGSQNEPRQRFCGRCGVSHEWLALHCSPIYLAARIIKRRGNELVHWYDADGTRIPTPWPQGPPLELEPANLRETARMLASSGERATTAPDPQHTQLYTPPRADLATDDAALKQVAQGRESVVRETAERLAEERRERERLKQEEEAKRQAIEAERRAQEQADRERLAAQRRAEQEAMEARVAAEAAEEASRRQAEREALEAAERERRQRRDEQRAEREQAKLARTAEQVRTRAAEQEEEASDVPLAGWGDHLRQIARGEYDATEKRPYYEEARRQTERGAAARRPAAEAGDYKVRSGDVIATIVAGLLLLLLLLIVIHPRQGDDTELPGDTALPRFASEMRTQAKPYPAFVLRNL